MLQHVSVAKNASPVELQLRLSLRLRDTVVWAPLTMPPAVVGLLLPLDWRQQMHRRSHCNAGVALSCLPLLPAEMLCSIIQGFCKAFDVPHLQGWAGLPPAGQLADDDFHPGGLHWADCAAGRLVAPGECWH